MTRLSGGRRSAVTDRRRILLLFQTKLPGVSHERALANRVFPPARPARDRHQFSQENPRPDADGHPSPVRVIDRAGVPVHCDRDCSRIVELTRPSMCGKLFVVRRRAFDGDVRDDSPAISEEGRRK